MKPMCEESLRTGCAKGTAFPGFCDGCPAQLALLLRLGALLFAMLVAFHPMPGLTAEPVPTQRQTNARQLGSLLVAGCDSDNVIQFDLATGQWNEIARLPKGSRPRGIAVGSEGQVFLGLKGGKKNLVRLVRNEGGARLQDVTGPVGRFGPGMILFERGQLWAAGDTARLIYQIDPETGKISVPSKFKNHFNLVGLAAADGALYAGEYFQRSILRYKFGGEGTEPARIVSQDRHLNRPVGLAVGPDDTLCVGSARNAAVAEFDLKSGKFRRTLVDLGAGGKEGVYGIVYAPAAQRYYVASGSSIYEVDGQGRILAGYSSPALKKAYGIALVPPELVAPVARTTLATPTASGGPSRSSPETTPATRTVTMLKSMPGKVQITGAPGERYRLDATTDFKTWQPIATLENANGSVNFTDPDAGRFDHRFYRLIILQGE